MTGIPTRDVELPLLTSMMRQTWDAFDFFTVTLTVEELAESFGKTKTDITWGMTLVLMFRTVGSVTFGIAADRYGRKWPFIVNNMLFIVFELVSSTAPLFVLAPRRFVECWRSMLPLTFKNLSIPPRFSHRCQVGQAAPRPVLLHPRLQLGSHEMRSLAVKPFPTAICIPTPLSLDDIADAFLSRAPPSAKRTSSFWPAGPSSVSPWAACYATATAIEDVPLEARGLMSGLLQQGYAFGYLLAAAFARALVDTTEHAWRPLFWFGACPPVLIILWRLTLPETQAYQQAVLLRDEEANLKCSRGENGNKNVTQMFLRQGRDALREHWVLLVYLVLLMAGFNFMSHGSQDLYPTMLRNEFGFSSNQVTVTQIVASIGAMVGGTIVGFSSQVFGRRLSVIVMCIIGGALLYPYTFFVSSSSSAITAAAFFEQFCVQAAWGIIPIHLMELSPGAFRTFVVGTTYQLGNLVSSASSTIESTIGERFRLPPSEEEGTASGHPERFEYGKVICIFMGCVYVYVIILTILGPEHLGRNFDAHKDVATPVRAADTRADRVGVESGLSEQEMMEEYRDVRVGAKGRGALLRVEEEER